MNNNRGNLIVIEGIDGTGKSTNCKMLCEKLNNAGVKALYTFEPTNGKYGSQIRNNNNLSAKEELELFVLDRKEHVQKELKPKLDEGYNIILDRYFYSSVAYQGAKGIDTNYILEIHKDFIIKPDLVFIFHLDINTALNRILEKRGFVDRFESYEYLKKVDEIFYSFNDSYIHHIDIDKDIESINQELFTIIENSKMLSLSHLQ